MNLSITKVPMKPASPSPNSINDKVETLTPVTPSRNGRR